jgi:hypothetical protein
MRCVTMRSGCWLVKGCALLTECNAEGHRALCCARPPYKCDTRALFFDGRGCDTGVSATYTDCTSGGHRRHAFWLLNSTTVLLLMLLLPLPLVLLEGTRLARP